MGIIGVGTETYLYINGLHISEEIRIDKNKALIPAHQKLSPSDVSSLIMNDIDYAIIVLCSGSIAAQLKITAESPKELAANAWNSQWDLVLLGAIFNCDAVCNLQCTHSIDAIANDAILHVTNYHMHGCRRPYTITTEDSNWIKQYFGLIRFLRGSARLRA